VWGEVLIVAFGVSVVTALIRRVVARRQPQEGRAVPPGSEAGGGRWTAAGPVEGAFPVERTPHERDVGDAAFVDGFIIGRYFAPGDRADAGDARAGGSAQIAATGGGDEASDDDLDLDLAEAGFGAEVDFDAEVGFDGGFDDEFGSDDGFEDDDW
jgi:hypothetical protein